MDLRIAGASPRFDREGATVRQYLRNLAVIMWLCNLPFIFGQQLQAAEVQHSTERQ